MATFFADLRWLLASEVVPRRFELETIFFGSLGTVEGAAPERRPKELGKQRWPAGSASKAGDGCPSTLLTGLDESR